MLKSALARPAHLDAYGDNPDVNDLAAAYTGGIVKNHPFVDSNKRSGFILGILSLEINGMQFTASEEDARQAVLDLAAGTMDLSGYAAFLRENIIRADS